MATSYFNGMCRISANTFGDGNSKVRSTADSCIVYSTVWRYRGSGLPKQQSHRLHVEKLSRLHLYVRVTQSDAGSFLLAVHT